MPPGSDADKSGPHNLRNGASSRTRHLASHPTVGGSKTPKKRPKICMKGKNSEENRRTEAPEQYLVQRYAKMNLSRNGNSTQPSKPKKMSEKERRANQKASYENAEVYSKRLVRQIVGGYDMDGDSDSEVPRCVPQATISDNWKPEYNYGNQELAHPDDIPQMEVEDDGFILDEKPEFVVPAKLIACDVTAPYYESSAFMSPPISPKAYTYQITAQDEAFIRNLNKDRVLTSGLPYLNIEKFHTVMTTFEEQVFINIHNTLLDKFHAVYARPPEIATEADDAVECDVCRISECDTTDEMVYCDMCNTCVHMLCAGITTTPPEKDPWKCVKCQKTNSTHPPCHFCPTLGGSMAPDDTGKIWAHHACALYMPEVHFGDDEARIPIKEISQVDPERYTQLCSVCDTRRGACITCTHPGCEVTFHVGCALRAGLNVKIIELPYSDMVQRSTKCYQHSTPHPSWNFPERFRNAQNPWLAQLEQKFYLMVRYEEVAEMLNLEEVVVSDIYEYWKQRRLHQKGLPLIPNLSDHIKTTSSVMRKAEQVAQDLARAMMQQAQSSASSSSSSNKQFFPLATLMVTELRQHHLKRVYDSLEVDRKMMDAVIKRETLKNKLIQSEAQALRFAMEMSSMGKLDPEMLADLWRIPKEEMEKARTPENFQKITVRLAEIHRKSTPNKMSKNFHWPRKDTAGPSTSSAGSSSHRHHKSPLRPRNSKEEPATSAKRRPGRARIYPIGYQKPSKYGRVGRPTKEQQRLQMLQDETEDEDDVTPISPSKSAPSTSQKPGSTSKKESRSSKVGLKRRRMSFPPPPVPASSGYSDDSADGDYLEEDDDSGRE